MGLIFLDCQELFFEEYQIYRKVFLFDIQLFLIIKKDDKISASKIYIVNEN